MITSGNPGSQPLGSHEVFERARGIQKGLAARISDSPTEAAHFAIAQVGALDTAANNGGLMGQPVTLQGDEMSRAVTFVDPKSGFMGLVPRPVEADGTTPPGMSPEVSGMFAGFTGGVRPVKLEPGDDTAQYLYVPSLRVFASTGPIYADIACGEQGVSGPVEATRVTFWKDTEGTAVHEILKKLGQLGPATVVDTAHEIDSRHDGAKRFDSEYVQATGLQVSSELDQLRATNPEKVERVADLLNDLIREKLFVRPGASFSLTSRCWLAQDHTTNRLATMTDTLQVKTRILDITYTKEVTLGDARPLAANGAPTMPAVVVELERQDRRQPPTRHFAQLPLNTITGIALSF